ncbi:NAD(P)-dependent alcohol dehydrogenase, partial [Calditrichota bacterium]
KPKIKVLGGEFSGVIEAVGKAVTQFKIGDEIFGSAGVNFGAWAEYLCLPEDGEFTIKSPSLSFEEAACSDGLLTGLPFLRDTGSIKKGQRVLINGASGAIGTAAVQLARYYETHVTGVCSSANVELVKSLGADDVIDYTKEDFTKGGEAYDIIFDTVGKLTFSKCKRALKRNGVFLESGIEISIFPVVLWTMLIGSKKAKIAATGLRSAADKVKDLKFLNELVEAGKYKVVIDRTYPLEEIVEAHRYVDTGHKKGNVVIKLIDSE